MEKQTFEKFKWFFRRHVKWIEVLTKGLWGPLNPSPEFFTSHQHQNTFPSVCSQRPGLWHPITSGSHLPVIWGSYVIQWLWDETWLRIPVPTFIICLTLNKFPKPPQLLFSEKKWRYSCFCLVFPPDHELLGSWDRSWTTCVLPALAWHQPPSTCAIHGCWTAKLMRELSQTAHLSSLRSCLGIVWIPYSRSFHTHTLHSLLQESPKAGNPPLQCHWR